MYCFPCIHPVKSMQCLHVDLARLLSFLIKLFERRLYLNFEQIITCIWSTGNWQVNNLFCLLSTSWSGQLIDKGNQRLVSFQSGIAFNSLRFYAGKEGIAAKNRRGRGVFPWANLEKPSVAEVALTITASQVCQRSLITPSSELLKPLSLAQRLSQEPLMFCIICSRISQICNNSVGFVWVCTKWLHFLSAQVCFPIRYVQAAQVNSHEILAPWSISNAAAHQG